MRGLGLPDEKLLIRPASQNTFEVPALRPTKTLVWTKFQLLATATGLIAAAAAGRGLRWLWIGRLEIQTSYQI